MLRLPVLPPHLRRHLPLIEKLAIATAFAWCLYRSVVALGILYYVQGMDSAGFVELIVRAAEGHGINSPSFASFYVALPLMFGDAAHYCAGDFTHTLATVSFSRWHPYFAAFLLAVPVQLHVMSALTIGTIAISLSEFGLLFLLLFWLRSQGLSLLLAAFFALTLFAWIPWAQGAFGQLYFDRLFLLSMAGMVLLTDRYIASRRGPPWAIVLLALFIMTISERTTMMLGGFLLAYPLIFRGFGAFRDRRCWLLFTLAGLAVSWSVFFLAELQNDPTASLYSIPSILDNLGAFLHWSDPRFIRNLKLLVVLAPYILIAFFNPRMALIGVGSILPNFLVNIGGAERIGFLTHYHSTYLPFLAVAAGFGLVAAHRRFGGRAWFGPGAALLLCLVFFYNRHIDFRDDGTVFRYTKPEWSYQFAAVFPQWHSSPYSGLTVIGEGNREVAARLPPGVAVTAQEPFMPALVAAGHEVDYLPVGLDRNPYALIAYPSAAPETLPDVSTYRPEAEIAEKTCLRSYLARHFRTVERLELVGGRRVAVMTRLEASPAPSER